MLFQSQAKADNFIKFNSNEIAAQSNKVPVRSYYCSFCCGWHITSVADETHAKIDDERDKHLWKQIHARTKKQLPSDELGVEINEMLSAIDILFKQIESAIKGVQLDVAQDLFKEITLKFTIVEEKIQHLTGVFSAVEKRRIKISSLIGTFELIDDYIIDEDARTQYLQEHSTPKTATTISLYFENKAFLENIELLFNQVQQAQDEGNSVEVLSVMHKISDVITNSQWYGLSKKRKHYRGLYNALLSKL